MKQCFIAEDQYELWEFDYAQLELRIGTAYAEEAKLLEIFRDRNRDIFGEMASDLQMARQDTKTMNYALAYGAGLKQLAKVFGVTYAKAAEMRDNYFAQYPGFRKASDHAGKLAKRDGKIKLWSGRYRHRVEPHKAFNSIIQGGAADVVEDTMLRLHDEGFNTDQCRMLLQIHDSVVFEIRKEIVDVITPRIIKCMEAVPAPFDHITFKVEGKAWPTKIVQ
jgi:DNA polymerase-1